MAKVKKRGRGRPKVLDDSGGFLHVRISNAQKKQWEKAAVAEGLEYSAWVRHSLSVAAKKALNLEN